MLIVDSLNVVDTLSRPNVYFNMYFSRNSEFSRYSGQFDADERILYYERRLYLEIANGQNKCFAFTQF